MFKNILVGLSSVEACGDAVDGAVSLARECGGRLTFFTSVLDGSEDGHSPSEANKSSLEGIGHRFWSSCAKSAENLGDWGVEVSRGFLDIELLRAARHLRPDLIIMGPDIHCRIDDEAGRMTEVRNPLKRVAREARCPVMVIARPAGVAGHYDQVLAASDLSAASCCAVDYACRMVKDCGAKLTVMHVVSAGGHGEGHESLSKRLEQGRRELSKAHWDSLQDLPGVKLVVREGEPAREIMKWIRDQRADLAVLAHHARPCEPETASMGSTTLEVALNAACPVITLNRDFVPGCPA